MKRSALKQSGRQSALPLLTVAFLVFLVPPALGQNSTAPETVTLHPALFIVGDSTVKTGSGNGERGPWGWGSEIISFFDQAKIHVYNEALGGRSSRGYIEEGAWARIISRMQAGDFVIIQFGHNDTANSQNYPDRATITGTGDETTQLGVGDSRKIVHSYGWYLRQYVKDAKARHATVIICSPVPRNTWIAGKITRGFDGYAEWAAAVARSTGALFIDLNTLTADRYDALGQEGARPYFNDAQHTTKIGARVNAESVVAGIRKLKDHTLSKTLAPATHP